MSNVFKWLENLWNLRLIFDKYLPKIREILETIKQLQSQIEDLRQAKIDLQKELEKMKQASKPAVEQDPESPDEPSRITKVNRYYDPQLGVEYLDFEINGEKASPEDDTVKE